MTKGFAFVVMKKARKWNTTGSFCELHSAPLDDYQLSPLPSSVFMDLISMAKRFALAKRLPPSRPVRYSETHQKRREQMFLFSSFLVNLTEIEPNYSKSLNGSGDLYVLE